MHSCRERRRRRWWRILALALALCPAWISAGQNASSAPRISADELMTWVRTMSAPQFEGRRSGTDGNVKARAAIASQLRAIGITPLGEEPDSFVRTFQLTERNTAPDTTTPLTTENRGGNVVGLCRGTGAADGPAMVLSAHYDHLGVRGGTMYPGADDNASGVAVLLALARRCRLHPWAHDAVFAFFDGEERGLQGARAFLAAPPIPRSPNSLNLNLDRVRRSERRELDFEGT
jgi:hypothetical protein